ncbi:MAG TPA: FkbM family methyltransferase, partial [Solirubrobacteraceae bacterium]|nr:FkbM family methyltransferase [Solirubrobacteraceae bacterium]
GFFSLLAARCVGSTGRVYALEPEPGTAAALRANIRLNGFDQVTVLECAASSAPRTAALAVPPGASAFSRLVANGAEHEHAVAVQVVTVDDLVSEGRVQPPVMVKIDVEGAELEVIDGMRATLGRCRPGVICELHATGPAVRALMRSLGYDMTPLEGDASLAGQHGHVLATPRASASELTRPGGHSA